MVIALLARYDEWCHLTALVWVGCVFFFMVWFAVLVLVTEISAGIELLRIQHAAEQEQRPGLPYFYKAFS